jgi:hypothetical protein
MLTVKQYFETMRFDGLQSNCECYNDNCVKRILTFYDFNDCVNVSVCNMHYRLCIENNAGDYYNGLHIKKDANSIAKELTTLIGKNLIYNKYNLNIIERKIYCRKITDLSEITIDFVICDRPFAACTFYLLDIINLLINTDRNNWYLKENLHRSVKNELIQFAANTNYKKYATAHKSVQIALKKLQSYSYNYDTDFLQILIELFNLNIKTKQNEINN